MGIFDFLKKKTPKIAENGALALDELPPIPSEQSAVPKEDVLPLSDLSQPGPLSSEHVASESLPDTSHEGLTVPTNHSQNISQVDSQPAPEVNNELFDKLNADLAASAPREAPGPVENNQVKEPTYEDEVPSKEEIKEVLSANKEEELPGFAEELNESQEDSKKESSPLKTESLLLKSIFVEREHYANLLFSLRTVKDDLEKSGPQQRKLSNIDMKLGAQYSKLSTLFENFNENVMMIEHIVSNEKF